VHLEPELEWLREVPPAFGLHHGVYEVDLLFGALVMAVPWAPSTLFSQFELSSRLPCTSSPGSVRVAISQNGPSAYHSTSRDAARRSGSATLFVCCEPWRSSLESPECGSSVCGCLVRVAAPGEKKAHSRSARRPLHARPPPDLTLHERNARDQRIAAAVRRRWKKRGIL
jgi:hypothetical protein